MVVGSILKVRMNRYQNFHRVFLVFFLSLLFGFWVHAQTVGGVSLPDDIQIEGERLLLNGMGIREKYWQEIYVIGLYLPYRSGSADQIMYDNVPKRLQSTFIFPKVSREQLQDSLTENLDRNPSISHETKQQMMLCRDWMEDLSAGDEIIFDYHPEVGTSVSIKGEVKGVIPGEEFMQAILYIYLGPNASFPPLRDDLLGL
jgi:hypothetical protein